MSKNGQQLPLEVVQSATEAELAKCLLMAHEPLRKALDAFVEVYKDGAEKLRNVMRELYASQLMPKEQTAVLRAYGFAESRISEIKRICCDTEANFKRYIGGEVGFRLALESGRRSASVSTGGNHEAGKNMEKRIADALFPLGLKVRKSCVAWVTLEHVELKITIKAKAKTKHDESKAA